MNGKKRTISCTHHIHSTLTPSLSLSFIHSYTHTHVYSLFLALSLIPDCYINWRCAWANVASNRAHCVYFNWVCAKNTWKSQRIIPEEWSQTSLAYMDPPCVLMMLNARETKKKIWREHTHMKSGGELARLLFISAHES